MNQPRHMRFLLHTALLLLVLSGAGHIHNHVCLDGQEPADLVHFENLGGHPEHEDDATHVDVENELMPQVLLAKTLGQDNPLHFATLSLLFSERPPVQGPYYLAGTASSHYLQPSELTPPSRGPPTYSA